MGSPDDTSGDNASEVSFYSRKGEPLSAPREWTPAYVAIPTDKLDNVRVSCQGKKLVVLRRELGGAAKTLARWPRRGPGGYRLRWSSGARRGKSIVRIAPSKIDTDAFVTLLEDLEKRLPASIVLQLHKGGALAGLDEVRSEEHTLEQELFILRRAVRGTRDRAGLRDVLLQLGRKHHSMLVSREEWVHRRKARRPAPHRLRDAVVRPRNLEKVGSEGERVLPRRVVDARVEHAVDLYENRLVNSYCREVDLRLRRLRALLPESSKPREAVERLARELGSARRSAPFLNHVGYLELPPTRLTMVLLKRAPYRAALSGFQELHRRLRVSYDDPRLEAPLRNLPTLYQVWATLGLLDEVLRAALDAGFHVKRQRLVRRAGTSCFVKILPDGRPALEMEHTGRGLALEAIPERSYTPDGTPLRSDSNWQKPDLAVEARDRAGNIRAVVFDPKYKLWSEFGPKGEFTGRPKKVDIDRMHAYRDAIRDTAGRAVVEHAAILYPGKTVEYRIGVSAIRAVPGDSDSSHRCRSSGVLGALLGLG